MSVDFSLSPYLSRVLDRYAGKFHRISCGTIPADEFRQIGLIAIWKAPAKYDATRGEFDTYASICAFREMFHYLRMNSHPMGWAKRKGINRPACGKFEYDHAAHEKPEVQERGEFAESVRRMFPALTAGEIEILSLRFYDGLSCAEIANRIGKSNPRTSSILMGILRTINPAARAAGGRIHRAIPDHERSRRGRCKR